MRCLVRGSGAGVHLEIDALPMWMSTCMHLANYLFYWNKEASERRLHCCIDLNFSVILQFILTFLLVVDWAEWYRSCGNQVTLILVLKCGCTCACYTSILKLMFCMCGNVHLHPSNELFVFLENPIYCWINLMFSHLMNVFFGEWTLAAVIFVAWTFV